MPKKELTIAEFKAKEARARARYEKDKASGFKLTNKELFTGESKPKPNTLKGKKEAKKKVVNQSNKKLKTMQGVKGGGHVYSKEERIAEEKIIKAKAKAIEKAEKAKIYEAKHAEELKKKAEAKLLAKILEIKNREAKKIADAEEKRVKKLESARNEKIDSAKAKHKSKIAILDKELNDTIEEANMVFEKAIKHKMGSGKKEF